MVTNLGQATLKQYTPVFVTSCMYVGNCNTCQIATTNADQHSWIMFIVVIIM